MFDNIQPENLIYIDIETVPQSADFGSLSPEVRKLWDKKSTFFRNAEQSPEEVYQRAGIYAEFGKIICISCGLLFTAEGKRKIRLKSFSGEDETLVLKGFAAMLAGLSAKRNYSLCAHNGKEFDFPYIARRMLINGINLPSMLDTAGKKPWEVTHVDTMELWKFGDFKNYTSLELLAHIFGIPSPKDDIDGSMVAEVYYVEKDLPRIVKYCEKDVVTVIRLLLKMKGLEGVEEGDVGIAE